jgi:hypothetical protein
MGLRQCCCGSREESQDLIYINPKEESKYVFKITSKEKIRSFDFADSNKIKRFKLKHKKRILIVNEDNTINLVSFYLGNLTFLLNSIRINEKYKILDCVFLDKSNSTRFALFLEDSNKKMDIFIIKIEKDRHKQPIELNINENDTGQKNNNPNRTTTSSSFTLNEKNKQAVEAIVNSSCSSEDDDSSHDYIYESDTHENYGYEFTENYFQNLPLKTAKKKYENVIMAKYNFYKFHLKILIDDFNHNINQILVKDHFIYVFSEMNSLIKCYKIKNNVTVYKCLFTTLIKISDPYTDLIFPVQNDSFIIIDGLYFMNYKYDSVTFKKHFKELFNNRQGSNWEYENDEFIDSKLDYINFIKITKVISVSTQSKLKGSLYDNSKISNFFITGLCNEESLTKNLQQFIAIVSINSGPEINPHFTKLKIMNSTIPFISELCFGPYDNGPLISGHNNGTISLWNIFDLTITRSLRVFNGNIPISLIRVEPLGQAFCAEDNNLVSLNITDKKFEYFYNENENNELERVVRFITAQVETDA